MRFIENIILILALISPCIPKLLLFGDVTVYPVELMLVVLLFQVFHYVKFKFQVSLFALWGIILLCTMVSFLTIPYVGGLMKCAKEILYIPLAYLAYKSKWLSFRHVSILFIVAVALNMVYMAGSGFSFDAVNIWDSDTMLSGFSNKYVSLGSFNIESLEVRSHGIWADYCSLSLLCSFFAYYFKQISRFFFFIVIFLCLLNISLSVSREGMILMLCTFLGLFYASLYNEGRLKIRKWHVISACVLLSAIFYILYEYGEYLAIVQKLQYTSDSFQDDGSEGNILARINTWKIFAESLTTNPIRLFIGYGYNPDNFSQAVHRIASEYYIYTNVPESFIVESIMFGGVLGLMACLSFWRQIVVIIRRINDISTKSILGGFIAGLFFISCFSGAAIVSDLFYGQFLIMLGLLLKNETNLKESGESIVVNNVRHDII